MAREINRLSARQVETASKPGRYADGGNLYLVVTPQGGRKWAFLYRWHGKQKEMGLGKAGKGGVSLAKARELADKAREHLAEGRDPIAVKSAARDKSAKAKTFGEVADEKLASLEKRWRNPKHRHQWHYCLKTLAAPLRLLPVDQITTADVLTMLQPIWKRTPETASRLRGRVEAVLSSATVQNLRSGDNPARWRGHLDQVLSPRKTSDRKNHPAMPYAQVPNFVSELRERESLAARSLELCILTATRTSETLNAEWTEIDFERELWIIPRTRMKAGKEHRILLPPRALALLKELSVVKFSKYIFPGSAPRRPLSNMAMTMLLRRMKVEGASVHGFRSSFKSWATEMTSFPPGISEAALAHQIPSATERAYDRAELLDRRRALLVAWEDYLAGPASAKVIPLAKVAR